MLTLSAICQRRILTDLSTSTLSSFNEYKKLKTACLRANLNTKFLERCIRHDLLPHFITRDFQHCPSSLFQKARGDLFKSLRAALTKNKEHHATVLMKYEKYCKLLDPITSSIFTALCHRHLQTLEGHIGCRHESKFALLKDEQPVNNTPFSESGVRNVHIPDAVVNNSSHQLSEDESLALNLGINMSWAFTPNPINCQTNSEVMFRSLCSRLPQVENDEVLKTQIKSMTYMLCKRQRKIPKVVSRLQNAVKRLGKNSSLYIAKFDKGNGVHVDDRVNYITKMKLLLSDNSKFCHYKSHGNAKQDPLIVEEDKLNRQLLQLHKMGKISAEILSKTRSVGAQPARLYGLAKVHKTTENPPYRPILSMPNSYKTNLSKWLDELLKPFIPSTYTVNDTFEFVEKLRNCNIDADTTVMVSFDVISLFTNIPIAATIQHTLSCVEESQLPISLSVLQRLLFLACSNVMFSFDSELYVQKDGMCMGSPLGPTMAAFAMDMVEQKVSSYSSPPLFYSRYVDDIFAIFNHENEVTEFLKFLNSIVPQLQFTAEMESQKSLVFLDTKVVRHDGRYATQWHCKSTNTGRYIPSMAYSPPKYQKAACRCLIYRVKRICSTPAFCETAIEEIKAMFIKNGYTHKWFNDICTAVDRRHFNYGNFTTRSQTTEVVIKPIYWKVPYVRDQYAAFARCLSRLQSNLPRDLKIIPIYETLKSSSFLPNKDRVAQHLASHVVYEYQCERCQKCYIGETVRHLCTRAKEHITGKPQQSEISQHEHTSSMHNFKVLARSRYTKVAEAVYISDRRKRHFELLNIQSKSLPLYLF